MNEQKQIEAMARLDGIEGTIYAEDMLYVNGPFTGSLPDYLTDHNAVQRVIDGFDYMVGQSYHTFLAEITGCSVDGFIKATPAQKVEAILKAKGEWE